ncbi:MAG: YceI family protein [Candidatus Limnocylindrales bacterium]|nr:YceI family protein [Candidatus Limnocylindrales bacterium]
MQPDRPPARGRFRSRAWLVVAFVVLVAVGVGAAGFVYFFDQSVPAAVSLGSATSPATGAGSAGAPATAVTFGSAAPASSAAGSTAAGGTSIATGAGSLDGTWTVDTSIGSFSDFTDSFVGYRVAEQLANVGATTAVGRTPKVSGTLTVSGTSITAVSITADLTALQSDRSMRDGQLHTQALQTDTYPTATFVLADPIKLDHLPAESETISVTAVGDLTLHGATKRVSIPLQAKLANGVVTVVGSLPIAFADYSIAPPQSMMVLSVADNGTMELQLHFTKG